MKNNLIISVTYVLVLTGAVFYNGCKSEKAGHSVERTVSESENEEFELADVMFKFQRHFSKLWFAGNNNNWPLAAFYVHELEEAIEELENAKVIEEGQNVSELAKVMAHPVIQSLEQAVSNKNQEEFKNSYHTMINTCNACHVMTKYEFIVIQLPEKPVFDNQVY